MATWIISVLYLSLLDLASILVLNYVCVLALVNFICPHEIALHQPTYYCLAPLTHKLDLYAGKSTILRLIFRFFDTDSGNVSTAMLLVRIIPPKCSLFGCVYLPWAYGELLNK